MLGSPIASLDEGTIPRPLRVVRALVLVLIGMDLLGYLLRPPVVVNPWLYYPVVVLSAGGSALALFRPVLALAVVAVPISSALTDPFGQDITPLLVTTVMVWAVARVQVAALVTLGYLAFAAAIAAGGFNGPIRGAAVAAVVSVCCLVGGVIRVLWWRHDRMDRRIRRLHAQTARLKAAERTALADELSQLLADELHEHQRELAGVQASTDAAALSRVLERAEGSARNTLAQLRALVSTLRGRDAGTDRPAAGARGGLVEIAEEVEEVLVGHGHPVTLEVPATLPRVGDFSQQLLGSVLREAGALMVRQAPPGLPCAITVCVESDRLSVEVEHPGSGTTALRGLLLAAQQRVAAAGGTIAIDVPDDSWGLRASMPVLTGPPKRPAPARRRFGWRGTAQLVAVALGLVMAIRAALELAAGSHGWAWWALSGLAWIGLAVLGWAIRYSVAIMIAVLLVGLLSLEPSLVLGQPAQLAITVLAMVGVLHRGRWAWIVTIAWAAYNQFWFRSLDLVIASTSVVVPFVGVMIGLAIEHFRWLHTYQDHRLKVATTHHDAARDDVRRELAGELHDIVAHQLSLITMQASSYRGETEVARLRAGVDRVASINASAQADLALLLHVMQAQASGRPDADTGWLSPTAAVEAAVRTLREAGHPAHGEIDPAADGADPTTRKTLTRIVREATTNILRYAPPGQQCRIDMVTDGDGVRLSVDSPLPERPRHSAHSTGLGLIGLEERARITGGTFVAGASAGRWQVLAELPLTAQFDLRPRADDLQLEASGNPPGSTMPSWIPRIRI